MLTRRYRQPALRALLVLLALLLLAGCAVLRTPAPDLEPGEVVHDFYRWYIGYPGNPLVDRAYRTSPYLTPTFVAAIDETMTNARGGGDPLLLAQDIPQEFEVADVEVDGDRATVIVDFTFSGQTTAIQRRVDLELIDGAWKMTGVHGVER